MAIDFLGHKASLSTFIADSIHRQTGLGRGCDVVDLFCGTAAMAASFKAAGWNVTANDHLVWCSTFAEALLLNEPYPAFACLLSSGALGLVDSPDASTASYDAVLRHLNQITGINGFLYRQYSPASEEYGSNKRMYFSEANARRIDAIRAEIGVWEDAGLLSRGERALLLRDLIRAANAVSNTAGTYGAYLKHWKARALEPLTVRRSRLIAAQGQHRVFGMDANQMVRQVSASVVYADPPYTKRQYAAYYHVLETIVMGDEPVVSGSTGLRPWQEKSSAYCYRAKAPGALQDLVLGLDCKHFFLSYNEDGQISHASVVEILSSRGEVTMFEHPYRRYKSSSLPHKGGEIAERLYHLALP